jgi:hypothetical protein
VLCLALGACAAVPAVPSGPQPVTTEAAFRAGVVGRDLEGRGEVLRIVPNGSWLERRANHIAASGVWRWIGAEWCHEGRRDGTLYAQRCEAVVVDGATVTLGARVLRRE